MEANQALTEGTQELTVLSTVFAPVDYGQKVEGDEPVTLRWHFLHKYTEWGDPFSSVKPGLSTLFGNGSNNSVWWQARRCVICNLTQHRRVELIKDRT